MADLTKFPLTTNSPQIEVTLPVGENVLELVVEDSAVLRSAPDRVVITVVQALISTITPNTGVQGAAVDVIITGRGLAEVSRISFSGEGIRGRVLGSGSSDSEVKVQILTYKEAEIGKRTFQLLSQEGVIVDSKEFGVTFEVTRGLPTVTRPTVTSPTVTGPTITRPTVTMPTITMPTITRPTVTRPTVTMPTATRPTRPVPIITQPIVPDSAPERLTEIRGIGSIAEGKLHEADIRSVKDLALASPERVAEVLGMRDIDKAKIFIDEAKRLTR